MLRFLIWYGVVCGQGILSLSIVIQGIPVLKLPTSDIPNSASIMCQHKFYSQRVRNFKHSSFFPTSEHRGRTFWSSMTQCTWSTSCRVMRPPLPPNLTPRCSFSRSPAMSIQLSKEQCWIFHLLDEVSFACAAPSACSRSLCLLVWESCMPAFDEDHNDTARDEFLC